MLSEIWLRLVKINFKQSITDLKEEKKMYQKKNGAFVERENNLSLKYVMLLFSRVAN